MEAISCLVPELWSKKHCGRGMQLFEKTQCFYVAKCIVLRKLTRVLVKRQLESQLGKTAVAKVGGYIVSADRKTTVYRLSES